MRTTTTRRHYEEEKEERMVRVASILNILPDVVFVVPWWFLLEFKSASICADPWRKVAAIQVVRHDTFLAQQRGRNNGDRSSSCGLRFVSPVASRKASTRDTKTGPVPVFCP